MYLLISTGSTKSSAMQVEQTALNIQSGCTRNCESPLEHVLVAELCSFAETEIWSDQNGRPTIVTGRSRHASFDTQLDARRAAGNDARPHQASLATRASRSRGEPNQYETKADAQALKHYKIRCWGSVTLTLAERNLAAKNARPARRAPSTTSRSCSPWSHELEGEIITLVPATVGKIIPDGTPEEEWKWLIEGVKECYEHGKKKGVRIAIEPLNRFETYFLNRADQALGTRRGGRPRLRRLPRRLPSQYRGRRHVRLDQQGRQAAL